MLFAKCVQPRSEQIVVSDFSPCAHFRETTANFLFNYNRVNGYASNYPAAVDRCDPLRRVHIPSKAAVLLLLVRERKSWKERLLLLLQASYEQGLNEGKSTNPTDLAVDLRTCPERIGRCNRLEAPREGGGFRFLCRTLSC
jgi:hypothetical protein